MYKVCLSLLFLPFALFASWADDALAEMSLDEKIGQLFAAPACPRRGEDHRSDWARLLSDFHIGNAIVKQSGPEEQVRFLDFLQSEAEIPLLIAADAEWGLAMRMSDTVAFPRNMTLGAVQDLDAIYRMGREIGKEAKRVGIHLNLAPVADVNNNPRNPIIHMRSFGEDARNVADRVSAYIRGMQDEGILACAKHFPGHGDTVVDSHFDLPRIPFDQERLERVELTPFRRAIGDGVAAVMSAHLLVSALDPDRPASLSRRCLEEMLREEMEFGGLIISDALNMQALARYYSPEETAILARGAGCDLLLYGDHIDPNVDKIIHEAIPRAWNALKDAYLRKELSMDELDAAVLRLLRAKEKIGLHRCRAIPTGPVVTEEALALKRELFQKAVTRLGETILLKENCAYLSVGPGDVLAEEFGSVFSADAAMSREEREAIAQTLAPFEQVVIGVHQGSGFSDEALELIRSLSDKAILCHFATPYALRYFEGQGAILIGYENDPEAQRALFDVLTRQRDAPGHLPVRSSVDEKDQHRGRKEFESTQRGKS